MFLELLDGVKNILRGVDVGKRKNCHVITMSGFKPDNPLRSTGEMNFYGPSNSYGYVEITHLALCHSIEILLWIEDSGLLSI